MILRSLLVLAGAFWLSGCDSKGSVNSLYRFPEAATLGMKDVKVQVNVLLGGNALNDVVTLNDGSFLLNAYSLDGDGQQAELGYVTGTPAMDLPVTLATLQTTFDVNVRLPADIEPGEEGYAFHFQLKSNTGATLTQGEAVSTNLDALKGAVRANTEPSANIVDLSLASTLAYSLLKEAADDLRINEARQSYEDIVTIIQEQQAIIEGSDVDTGTNHTVSDYIQGMKAALENKVVKISTIQSAITEKLLASIKAYDAASEAARAEKIATALTRKLKEFAQSVKATLANGNTTVAKVFKTDSIGELPDPDTISTAVFSPASVAFTDTDDNVTLGGTITITAPQVTTGITAYNIYFGGSTVATRQTKLLGKVPAGTDLSLVIPAGTAIPAGAAMFWVYPVSNTVELDVPRSLTIVNLITPKAPRLKDNQTYTFNINAQIGDFKNMTNEGGGDLTSCEILYAFAPMSFEIVVSPDKTTCVVKVAHVIETGVSMVVGVKATNAVGSHSVTATLVQEARLAAPNLVDGSISFANSDPVGTKKNVTNSGGGSLTACEPAATIAPAYFTVGISDDGNTCAIELTHLPQGIRQETIIIRAINDLGDSVGQYNVTRNGPNAPNLQNEVISFAYADAAGTRKPIINTGGGELSSCTFILGSLDPSDYFDVELSSNGDTCDIVRSSSTTDAGYEGTYPVEAVNSAGNAMATMTLRLLPPPPVLDPPVNNIAVLMDAAGSREVVINNSGGKALSNCQLEELQGLTGSLLPFSVDKDQNSEHCVLTLGQQNPAAAQYEVRVWAVNAAGSSSKITFSVDVQEPPAGLKIFVSNQVTSAGLNSDLDAADTLCSEDEKKPNDGKIYKALLSIGLPPGVHTSAQFSYQRYACLDGNCDSNTRTDWVLQPNSNYINLAGALIGVTTTDAVFSGSLSNAIQSEDVDVWTGTTSTWEPGLNCNGFNTGESWANGTYGKANSLTVSGLLSSQEAACNSQKHLICVEQP